MKQYSENTKRGVALLLSTLFLSVCMLILLAIVHHNRKPDGKTSGYTYLILGTDTVKIETETLNKLRNYGND